MRGWPKAFESDRRLRKAFESACEAIYIYGAGRNDWRCKLDKPTADFVWAEAKRLLNY